VPAATGYVVHDASATSVLVVVFSGMTVGDGPVSERRRSRLVYRKCARDTFLSGNGTDPMHGRKTIAARPPMDRSYGSTNPGPPAEEELEFLHQIRIICRQVDL
jgi:hypothetical protein